MIDMFDPKQEIDETGPDSRRIYGNYYAQLRIFLNARGMRDGRKNLRMRVPRERG